MFRFYWPWLFLLLPLPFFVWAFFRSEKKEEPPTVRFYALERLKSAFPIHNIKSKGRNYLFFTLLSLTWIFLVVAAMQPEKVNQYTQVSNKGYDLMLAVDISASMQALDFSTSTSTVSRLDVTKEVVGKFVRGRQGDRVGLVTFGQEAYIHVPLTLDTIAVSDMLNSTISGMAGNATAIGDAIGLGVRVLRNRPEGSRVLVLLTDGEDNASQVPPMEATKLAKQYGIRIYTIGVGKNGPVPFPNRYGGYAMVEMSLDEDLLKEIAAATGGHYFRATDKEALKEIYHKIDTLEKTEANQTTYLIRDPLYRYPLGGAIATLILLAALPIIRRMINGV